MAALDLSDLGLHAKPIYWLNGPATGEYLVEDAGLQAALDRLRKAAESLRDAWEALPPGVQERYGCTITLGAEAETSPATLAAGLQAALRDMDKYRGSDLTDVQKFDAVFRLHRAVVRPLLERAGLTLEWVDPDMDYLDDVDAYLRALRDLVGRLPP